MYKVTIKYEGRIKIIGSHITLCMHPFSKAIRGCVLTERDRKKGGSRDTETKRVKKEEDMLQ